MNSTVLRQVWPCLTLIACLGPKPSLDDTASDAVVLDFSPSEIDRIQDHSPLPPPRVDTTNGVSDHPDAARLGQFLFFDERLSGSGEHSCATCHQPEHGFSDPEPLSEAAATTSRHSPSLLGTANNLWYFWDGRCDSYWCQATGPLEHPSEHATDRLAIAHLLNQDEALNAAYTALFGDLPPLDETDRFPAHARPVRDDPTDPSNLAWEGMDEGDQHRVNQVFTNVAKAIGAYERLLVPGEAPFDRFVQGLEEDDPDKLASLSLDAQEGLRLFEGEGNCFACHSSPTFSNLEFHNIALPIVDGIENDSLGRYTGIEALLNNPFNGLGDYSNDPEAGSLKLEHLVLSPEQAGQFKTPSLRNVSRTAPYMHGGHFASLTEVVQHYNEMDDPPLVGHREELLRPRGWSDEQVGQVVAFLESLTGDPLDAALLAQPPSPLPE